MRALIVEADFLAQLRTAEALSDDGFSVIETACSSGEALIHARAARPDVVIVGLELESRMIGERLAKKLRQELGVHCLLTAAEDLDGALNKRDVRKIAQTAKEHARISRAQRSKRQQSS